MLLDVLHHVVAAEPDMVVVGRTDNGDLVASARRARADVIVVGRGTKGARKEREEFARLLRQRPYLKVLAIEANGEAAALYELHPRRVSLGEVSAAALCGVIRGRPAPAAKRERASRCAARVERS